MNSTHSLDNTSLIFNAILPWELPIGPPWLEKKCGLASPLSQSPLGKSLVPGKKKGHNVGLKYFFATRKSHLSRLPGKQDNEVNWIRRNKDESRERTDHLGRINDCKYLVISGEGSSR
jgi:hypothetical protein